MSTTITGNVKDLGAASVKNAVVRFYLRGTAGNQPRVTGVGALVPTSGSVWYEDFEADANGAISGTLYSTRDSAGTGNGDIEAGGSYQAVWYGMQLIQAGKTGPEVPVHAKNGATLDISSVTPITTPPVVSAPTGDGTYLRIDAGNGPVTGLVSFTGGISSSAISTFTGGIQSKNASAPSSYQTWKESVQATGEVDWDSLSSSGSSNVRAQYFLPWVTTAGQFNGLMVMASPMQTFCSLGGLTQIGRINTYKLPDPTYSPTVTHQGAGGAGSPTYYFRCIDSNSGYSLPSAGVSDATGYPSPDATHVNVITYQCPAGYTNAAIFRGNSLTGFINTSAAGVLSNLSVAACVQTGSCSYNDTGVATITWQANTGAFYANPDANTTAQAIFADKTWFQAALDIAGTVELNALGTANSGANFGSNTEKFDYTYWNGSAAAAGAWSLSVGVGTGSNPSSSLIVSHLGSSGTATVVMPILNAQTGIQINEGSAPGINFSGTATCYADSSAHDMKCSYNNGSYLHMPQVIASGTSTLNSGALAATTCQSVVTTSATGAATTDSIEWSFASAPATADGLTNIEAYPTSGNVNFLRCNPTAASQTTTALVINWRVIR